MAFTIQLPRVQTAKIWESKGADQSKKAKKLQELFDKGLTTGYESEKKKMEQAGCKFRLTDGKVFKIKDRNQTIQVPIKFQVKLGTLTWYFIAPKDETHQEFRDELYQAVALGHLNVDGHCEKYWRGTDSLHVNKMHTSEAEAALNHNHYRMEGDRDADPVAIRQHLMGLVKAQREMGLMIDGTEKFLTEKEAEAICHQFELHWARMNHVGPSKEVWINKEHVVLPHREGESIFAAYKKSVEQKYTEEDRKEWEQNKHKEEPCITLTREKLAQMSLQEKIKATLESTRGIGAELAMTRRVKGSKLKTIPTIVAKDDVININK